jgi:hypothetical protein
MMGSDYYPPEWLDQAPEPHDDPLDVWRPEPAELARAGELWQQCLDDDPRFSTTFDGTCDDVLLEKNLPRVLAAILLHGRALVEANCLDRKLAQARLSADVNSARDDAIREAIYRDDA